MGYIAVGIDARFARGISASGGSVSVAVEEARAVFEFRTDFAPSDFSARRGASSWKGDVSCCAAAMPTSASWPLPFFSRQPREYRPEPPSWFFSFWSLLSAPASQRPDLPALRFLPFP